MSAWRRRDGKGTDPAAVLADLDRRELTDLETCRAVWAHERDPLALVVALDHVDLPDWLRDALRVAVTNGADGYPPIPALTTRRLWRRRTRHAIDATRAAHVAMVRSHPDARASWPIAEAVGNDLAGEHYRDMPPCSPAGAKRSYHVVRRTLTIAPGRYFRAPDGTAARIQAAWIAWLEAMLSHGRK